MYQNPQPDYRWGLTSLGGDTGLVFMLLIISCGFFLRLFLLKEVTE